MWLTILWIIVLLILAGIFIERNRKVRSLEGRIAAMIQFEQERVDKIAKVWAVVDAEREKKDYKIRNSYWQGMASALLWAIGASDDEFAGMILLNKVSKKAKKGKEG